MRHDLALAPLHNMYMTQMPKPNQPGHQSHLSPSKSAKYLRGVPLDFSLRSSNGLGHPLHVGAVQSLVDWRLQRDELEAVLGDLQVMLPSLLGHVEARRVILHRHVHRHEQIRHIRCRPMPLLAGWLGRRDAEAARPLFGLVVFGVGVLVRRRVRGRRSLGASIVLLPEDVLLVHVAELERERWPRGDEVSWLGLGLWLA